MERGITENLGERIENYGALRVKKGHCCSTGKPTAKYI